MKRALVIVDLQEDFCPPNGALAVNGGRDILARINELLALPFDLKIATKDYHPMDHISFASNHPPPNNKPFESTFKLINPYNDKETESIRLWPNHCVQGTQGAELLPEMDKTSLDHIVEKGMDKRVEMYSAFSDPFRYPAVSKSKLSDLLKKAGITHVFVAGLAADYCVKYTAIDSNEEGFVTYIIEDATKAVAPQHWSSERRLLQDKGVQLVNTNGDDIRSIGRSS